MKHRTASRRTFLKTSAAVAAGPWVVPTSVFGAEAPGNRVTLAFLGVGGRANALIGNFVRHDDAQILAVCDCFESRRQQMKTKLNSKYGAEVVEAYADFRDVLARDDIDAVVVATPDHWHVPLAVAAAKAGKDMYVEKPLGVSMRWAQKLREALKETGRVFQYGTQQRSDPKFRAACELVRNGYIGEVERIEAWCPDMDTQYQQFSKPPYGSTEPGNPPGDLDYEMWLGPAPRKPYTVDRCTPWGAYHIYDYALGFIAGWGAHPLDIAQWGLDADATSPVRYEGMGSLPLGGLCDTIESWDVHCEYANGLPMRFMGSRMAEAVVSAYRPWVNHGTTFFGADSWVSVDRTDLFTSDPNLKGAEFKPDDVKLKASNDHARDFLDCVKSRETAVSHFEAAIRSDAISHLSNIAIRLERPIAWDPEKEAIVDDVEAEALLDRPIRAPWDLDAPMITRGGKA
jgi:predicted dehydrogenase